MAMLHLVLSLTLRRDKEVTVPPHVAAKPLSLGQIRNLSRPLAAPPSRKAMLVVCAFCTKYVCSRRQQSSPEQSVFCASRLSLAYLYWEHSKKSPSQPCCRPAQQCQQQASSVQQAAEDRHRRGEDHRTRITTSLRKGENVNRP